MSRVTVLLPTYNGAAYLRQCLASICRQTFKDWTVVVGDDASQDSSPTLVEDLRDGRFRLVRRPRNIGCYSNINLLLGEATGEYVAILNQDDSQRTASPVFGCPLFAPGEARRSDETSSRVAQLY